MVLSYYAYKAANVLLTRFAAPLKNPSRAPGLLSGAIGDFQFSGVVLFYFADAQLVHLGDQLFHQPLINLWKDVFDVRVAVGPSFAPYYTSQNISVAPKLSYADIQGAVIITKDDLAYSVSRLFPAGNYFVGVNYHLLSDPSPICLTLAQAVYGALATQGIELPPLPAEDSLLYRPYVPPVQTDAQQVLAELEGQMGASPRGWLAYNDFVNSAHRQASKRRQVIMDLARQKRSEGYKLAYLGSEQERLAAPAAPEFIDIDLRGRFSPVELYGFFGLPSVQGVITFDTFVMHVASALGKDLYVVRKSDQYPPSYRGKYVPMYPGAANLVKAYL